MDSNHIYIKDTAANRAAFEVDNSSVYQCDRYDYLLATGSGVIGALIDIFLVGAPSTSKEESSVFLKWSDKQTDNAVMKFAKLVGWKPSESQRNNPKSAIGYLERTFKVNYDQRHSGDVGDLFRMSTKDHHLKSLGHSPDIVGLFFSVLNQFTSTSSFVSDGQLITIETDTFQLKGNNLISKLFSGFVNWFAHIVSDIAGSSGATERGSGIALPFYNFTQLFHGRKYNVGKDKQTIAEIANRAFREGYDIRHGGAMAVPVILTELIIRFFWSLRSYFQYEFTLKESIPTLKNNASLRKMLIIGHGALSLTDLLDAGVKSGGNYLILLKNINLIAWSRLTMLVIKEVSIQLDIHFSYEGIQEIYDELNEAVQNQLTYLEKMDIKQYEKEVKLYKQTLSMVKKDLTKKELNRELHQIYNELNIEVPWEGNFDSFMFDSNNVLQFKRSE